MRVGMKCKAKGTFEPLYREGDMFVILEITNEKWLMPITAKRLKNGRVYGFHKDELEEEKL